MAKPKIHEFRQPETLTDFPAGPFVPAGYLIDTSAGMRTFRPTIDAAKCRKCMVCFLVCPDGAVVREEAGLTIDYDFCKGCGVCAHECKFGAISMGREGE